MEKIIHWLGRGPFLPFEAFEGLSGIGGLFLMGLLIFCGLVTFNKKWRDLFF